MTVPVLQKDVKDGAAQSTYVAAPSAELGNAQPLPVFYLQNEGRPFRLFCGFFFKFVCPLVALFILCLSNYYGPGLQVVLYMRPIRASWQTMMSKWESVHGPFIREYYYEGKTDSYFPFSSTEGHVDDDVTLPDPPQPSAESCSAVKDLRFDCFPRGILSEKECVQRGCCYQSSTAPLPSCFYPIGYASYTYSNIVVTDTNVTALLTAAFKSPYPKQTLTRSLVIQFQSADRLLIWFMKPIKSTVGRPWPKLLGDSFHAGPRSYDVDITPNSTGFRVIRKSNGKVVFDTKNIGGLMFSRRFAQISTALPSQYIYGLESRANSFPLNTNWNTIALLNHDIPPTKTNGYGTYSSYFCMEGDGKAHSVDFLSDVPVEFRLQPGGLTARFLGDQFAIVITLGETPKDVYRNQLPSFTRPSPPFWSLGFHFSRFGFKNTEDMRKVWNRFKNAKIPLDTLWTDIDYMDRRNDFTLSPDFKDLPQLVNELHSKAGMHYVLIIDPGVSGSEAKGMYPPYDKGLALDIFIKDPKGKKPIVGKVWNEKSTVFPDFSHPKTIHYWLELMEAFHNKLPFDGVWLDMNEPSNFVNGSTTGCPSNDLENPPYAPAIDGGKLNYNTVCMSAVHYGNVPHLFVHNSYAAFEAAITSFGLMQVRGEKSFVITRAGNFMTPSYAGMWTGDVYSTWQELKQSVRDLLTFNLLGHSMVGADICGFNGNTTADLCRRWHQLGAFYPFSRNHNTDDGIDQDPVALGIENDVKPALVKRYSLLPYLYTLFYIREKTKIPVVRPTFFSFPDQVDSYTVDNQFFWGDAVLVVPALDEALSYVKAYIGGGTWYDDKYTEIPVSGSQVILPAAPDEIPILYRGGHIIPMFNVDGATTTTQLRKAGSLKLLVALNQTQQATGFFYWDDGVSVQGRYTLGHFLATKGQLQTHMYVTDYKDGLRVDAVHVFAVDPVTNVTLNDVPFPFTYNQTTKVLTVEPKLPVVRNFTITW